MAEQRGVAARKHCSEVAAVKGEFAVADGVDAFVDGMKQTAADASPDRGLVETDLTQLLHRHDAVLPRGERG